VNDVSLARHPAPPRRTVAQGQEPRRDVPDGSLDRHRGQPSRATTSASPAA
jgi:hypothetical protein